MHILTPFRYFYKQLGYRIFHKVALNLTIGLLDSFGLAMFLPLLQMVNSRNQKIDTYGLGNLKFLVDGIKTIGLSINLFNILLILSVFFICKGGITYLSSIYDVSLRQFFIKKTRTSLTHLMGALSYKAFAISDVGQIQNTLSAEVARLSNAFQQFFGTIQQLIMVVIYILFAFFVDSKFGILICLGGGLTALIFNKIFWVTEEASVKLSYQSNFYQGLIIQYVNSFKYLKATGLLKRYSQKLLRTIEEIESTNKKIGLLGAIVSGIREPLLIVVVSSVILIQVNLLEGKLSTILISLLFFYRALNSMMFMQTSYNGYLEVSGSLENMTNFQNQLMANKETNGNYSMDKLRKDIVLKNIDFHYNEHLVLKNINLTINKNETVAFVGESGSGKTTLMNLIAGLMPISKGKILIDGIKSTDLDIASYQKRIGYITQDPVIFNDTIFNNITFWDSPSTENYHRFQKAICKASLKEYISNLPLKESTVLGNNGINISGGQKQRISIARELYKDIDILILDEATSALDSETENCIQQNLELLKGSYTILIVAHRLSTIKNADSIVLMSRGKISEINNFIHLQETSTKFKNLIKLQEL